MVVSKAGAKASLKVVSTVVKTADLLAVNSAALVG